MSTTHSTSLINYYGLKAKVEREKASMDLNYTYVYLKAVTSLLIVTLFVLIVEAQIITFGGYKSSASCLAVVSKNLSVRVVSVSCLNISRYGMFTHEKKCFIHDQIKQN